MCVIDVPTVADKHIHIVLGVAVLRGLLQIITTLRPEMSAGPQPSSSAEWLPCSIGLSASQVQLPHLFLDTVLTAANSTSKE